VAQHNHKESDVCGEQSTQHPLTFCLKITNRFFMDLDD
jgi:hypothetical protein